MSSNAHSFYYGGMFLSKLIDLIIETIAPVIKERDDQLVDLEYVKEKSQHYLRIYVDREPNGIDIDEIADLSEMISAKLDQLDPDPLPDPYVLEVSSPGIERPIKTAADWQKAQGQYIHVGLYHKIGNQKSYEGTLVAYDETTIKLAIKVKTSRSELLIPRQAIANSRLAIEF